MQNESVTPDKKKETKPFILNVAFHIHYELKLKHLKINYYLDVVNMTMTHRIENKTFNTKLHSHKPLMNDCRSTKKNIPEYKSS